MQLHVRIKSEFGESVSRDELATLYASELNWKPYPRKLEVQPDGLARLELPNAPVMLHAKLRLPGYGFLWVVADRCGQGYQKEEELDFVREAAESRIYEVEQYLSQHSFSPSSKCCSMLSDAKTLLTLANTSPQAAQLHTTALSNAMWAGELAAVERARATIAASPQRKNFLFGCGGFEYPYPGQPEVKSVFDSIFNYATLPFYLARVEWEKDKPNYEVLDRLQNAFEANGIQTKGHPLWWAHTAGMPPWTTDLHWDNGSIAREIDRVVRRSVERYRGRIHYYDAINESHDWCNAYHLTQQQQAEMTKLCCDGIHQADPSANAVINTCFMFGENVADSKTQWGPSYERNMDPYSYLERVEQLGTGYEIVGMQLYCPNRDMLAIEKMFDRFRAFGRPIHVTELGVPSHTQDVPPNTTQGDLYCLRYMYSGLWHEMGWNERLQADWLEDFYTIAYAHPMVEALTWWSITDPAYIPAAGLFYQDSNRPKEAAFRLRALEESWGFHFTKG